MSFAAELAPPALRVPSNKCQTLLYKAMLEYLGRRLQWLAAILLASKSIQNSSFGTNFLSYEMLDDSFVADFASNLLSPASCQSVQLTPALHVYAICIPLNSQQITDFIGELVNNTHYFTCSLTSLRVEHASINILQLFF